MPAPRTHAPDRTDCYRFTPELVAAAAACGLAVPALYFPVPAEWMSAWRGIADLYVSASILAFVVILVLGWMAQSIVSLSQTPRPGTADRREGAFQRGTSPRATAAGMSGGSVIQHPTSNIQTGTVWALVLLAVCAIEL